MACVYSALGSKVSVVELTDSLMPGTDKDLLRPFLKIVKERYESIMVSTRVAGMQATKSGIEVMFEAGDEKSTEIYDRVLVAIGRRANGDQLDVEKAGAFERFLDLFKRRPVDENLFVPGNQLVKPLLKGLQVEAE